MAHLLGQGERLTKVFLSLAVVSLLRLQCAQIHQDQARVLRVTDLKGDLEALREQGPGVRDLSASGRQGPQVGEQLGHPGPDAYLPGKAESFSSETLRLDVL